MLKEMIFQFIELTNTTKYAHYYLEGRSHYVYINRAMGVQMQVVVKLPRRTPFDEMENLVDKSIIEIECIDFIKV